MIRAHHNNGERALRQRDDVVHTVVLVIMTLVAAALAGWVLWEGADFYLTSLTDRPHHADFRDLRPAGRVGHGLGILGSAMVLLLLLYSARKRWRPLVRAGQLRSWLRYHIWLGVVGPLLLTLHTSFKVGGLVSVSYWSMMAVALSGVLGRYLYQQIPRNVLGEAMTPADAEAESETLLVDLAESHGMTQQAAHDLERLAVARLEGQSAPAALVVLPVINLMLARRLQTWTRLHGLRGPEGARWQARRWVLLTRRLYLFNLVRDLFHWWHVFHKPFAFIMILVMVIHVAVALALGYTWIS